MVRTRADVREYAHRRGQMVPLGTGNARPCVQHPREPATSYTLWSRDRLLGHTDLHYETGFRDSRMGDFVPTPFGERLMPTITSLSRTAIDLSRYSRQLHAEAGSATSAAEHAELLRRSTEYADCAAAENHCAALQLELRGPDGAIVPTVSIGIRDTEYLLSLADAEMEDFDFENGLDVEWDPNGTGEGETERPDAVALDDPMDDLEDLDSDFAALSSEPWAEPAFPRFQIHVRLVDGESIP